MYVRRLLFLLILVTLGCLQTPVEQVLSNKIPVYYPEGTKKILNPVSENDAVIEIGKRKYETYCALCHGKNGKGEADSTYDFEITPSSLVIESVKKRTDGELYWATRNGVNGTKMLAWKDILNDEEIWYIITYIRILQKGKI